MTAFYNEIDPYAAQWLRNLILAGYIAPGVVDERPVQEIEAWELAGFTQCHFFAGIGIWSLALRSAGWSDDRPIWTGSCPCQPFSNAGQRKGISDDRHLWPYWFDLIAQCRPSTVVGEQVASKDGLGWFDIVSADMESANYAIGASDLCAAGFGQAHLRQRIYFVGLADTEQHGRWADEPGRQQEGRIIDEWTGANVRLEKSESVRRDGAIQSDQRKAISRILGTGAIVRLAHHHHPRLEGRAGMPERGNQFTSRAGSLDGGLEHTDKPGEYQWTPGGEQSVCFISDQQGSDAVDALANTECDRRNRSGSIGSARWGEPSNGRSRSRDANLRDPGEIDERWMALDWLLCRNPSGEPSWRPVEPRTFPLAHGIAARMGKLRAFGNGLDKKTATAFCEVVREICDGV